ncbi:hypothetical protein EVJ58_g615 [Rhodofomes roseus]|uniref:Condensation domain-containing protein n=1 Tax=Rhodofomes roseus TaxID=34475 RepID=A0A4Y9Z6W2_9APHY|nr:hypothetical protein EVJ58_g615 [Rhodofomes roseus]
MPGSPVATIPSPRTVPDVSGMLKAAPENGGWTPLQRSSRVQYTRPMVGSESWIFSWREFGDGLGDVCHGFTLNTSLSIGTVEERLKNGICYLRFVAPLLGGTIEKGIHDPELGSWVYTPASGIDEVRRWAADTLSVVETTTSPNDFVNHAVTTPLPYTLSDGKTQYWKLFLLRDAAGPIGLFAHGTHALFDAHPTLKMLQILLDEIVQPHDDEFIRSLAWGEEWRNLCADPIIATGPREGWDDEGMKLVQFMQSQMTSPVPMHGLKPRRPAIQDVTTVHRVVQTLEPDVTRSVLAALKRTGHTVTQLVEAATILALFAENPDVASPEEAHVTLDLCFISLMKHLVPPYEASTHIVSCSGLVWIKVPYSVFRTEDDAVKRLCLIMGYLRDQYAVYLSSPHLPHLTARVAQMVPLRVAPPTLWPNKSANILTNIGVIDRIAKLDYYEHPGDAHPLVAVDDMIFCHSVGETHRPIVHAWTIKGRLHMQIRGADVWDSSQLEQFGSRILEFVRLISTASVA